MTGPDQVKGGLGKLCNECGYVIQQLKRGTPWATRAEGNVGITKSWVKIDNCHMVLWCCETKRKANIMSSSTRNIYDL